MRLDQDSTWIMLDQTDCLSGTITRFQANFQALCVFQWNFEELLLFLDVNPKYAVKLAHETPDILFYSRAFRGVWKVRELVSEMTTPVKRSH